MIYASEDLIHEHDGILFGLNILEKMIVKLKKNKEVELDHFEKDVMGEGAHESLHELLHNFKKIYLREES
jgi:hypothetical protein